MMLKRLFNIAGLLVLCHQPVRAQVHILFDATKYEMAGNADWVIDADVHNLRYHPTPVAGAGSDSNPQRYPTPDQSTVTSSTVETYWEGALSAWGIDCVKQGYVVETLPYNDSITYGDPNHAQDLSNYKIFVIDEPNAPFSASEKTAIVQFVKDGGRLFMICDHNNSDRDGDGWDSPMAWNDLLTNNTVQSDPFGFTFDLKDISQTSTNVQAATDDSIIHGPIGDVTSVEWSDGTTMTLNTAQNPSAKGVIFTNGSAAGATNAMAVYSRYGKGKVVAIGDSSPPDDGTGDPNDALYSSYATEVSGNHRRLIMNMTIWLATDDSTAQTSVSKVSSATQHCHVFPNPSAGLVQLRADVDMKNTEINVYDITGRVVAYRNLAFLQKGLAVPFAFDRGIYLIKIRNDNGQQAIKVTVY